MNNFFIFGDSYADEHANNDENWHKKYEYRWPNFIKKQYENKYRFKNFALQGSSPYSALQKLLKKYDDLKKNDIILFFLSDFDRIDFKCPDEIKSHISNIFYSYRENNCQLFDDLEYRNHQKLKAFYLLHELELDFFYKNFWNILPVETCEFLFISFLKNLSQEKDCKVILFEKNYNKKQKLFFLADTKNFYQYKKSLSKVSDDEYAEYQNKDFDCIIRDNRINHLSQENHKIMAQIISKIIESDFDLPKFKTNLYQTIEGELIVGSDAKKFIYE